MGDLLTIRLDEKEKEALALSSKLSELPISKLIMPHLSEGTKISLGAVHLFLIDRSITFDKRSFDVFTSMIMEPTRTGGLLSVQKTPAEVRQSSPKVIWDFFEIMHELNVIGKINSSLEDVTLYMDTSYVTPMYLKTLCYRIGEEYIRSGGNLISMDYQLASDLFFNEMLMGFYHNNATGTARSLSSQLYTHQGLFKDISKEMVNRYSEKTRTRKIQAIEVESTRKRGRPKKKRSKRFIAEEISNQ